MNRRAFLLGAWFLQAKPTKFSVSLSTQCPIGHTTPLVPTGLGVTITNTQTGAQDTKVEFICQSCGVDFWLEGQ